MSETSGQRNERFEAILKELIKPLADAIKSFSENGKTNGITPITEVCNVWELESGIYSVDTDATGAMVSLSNMGDYMLYGLLFIVDTTSSYGGKTFLILGCDESYMSVVRIGVVDEEGTTNNDFSNGHLLASSNVKPKFDIEGKYLDNDVYSANAVKEGLLLFAEMLEEMAEYINDHKDRIEALEQQAQIVNEASALVGGEETQATHLEDEGGVE